MSGDAPATDATPAADAAPADLLETPAADAAAPDAATLNPEGDKPATESKPDGDKPSGDDGKGEGSDAPTDLLADDDEGKTPDKPDGQADGKTEGAPETYEALTLPEGVQIDDAALAQSKALFGDLKLPLDAANKLVAHYAALQATAAEAQVAGFNKIKSDWAAELKADPEFGGANLAKTVGATKALIGKFGSPELLSVLREWGMGNNPELNRFCARINAALSPDTTVIADAAHQSAPKSPAEVMWPGMFQKQE